MKKNEFYLEGFYVIVDSKNLIVMKRDGKHINHALHLIFSLMTCGIWIIVWIALTQSQTENMYTTLTYDEDLDEVSTIIHTRNDLLATDSTTFAEDI